jgi:hypothetical protein
MLLRVIFMLPPLSPTLGGLERRLSPPVVGRVNCHAGRVDLVDTVQTSGGELYVASHELGREMLHRPGADDRRRDFSFRGATGRIRLE